MIIESSGYGICQCLQGGQQTTLHISMTDKEKNTIQSWVKAYKEKRLLVMPFQYGQQFYKVIFKSSKADDCSLTYPCKPHYTVKKSVMSIYVLQDYIEGKLDASMCFADLEEANCFADKKNMEIGSAEFCKRRHRNGKRRTK